MPVLNRLTFIRSLFDGAAARYERDVVPVYAPLAADFVRYAAPQPGDRVLDVGTGTGLIARLLAGLCAPGVGQVTGLDLSAASLEVARACTPSYVRYVCGDIQRPPFAARRFSLIVASFGLNATDPNRSLPALRRLIAPGGRIVIQEWGPEGARSRALGRVLERYVTPAPDERLQALRFHMEAYEPLWNAYVQDVEDTIERLEDLGLTVTHAAEESPVLVRLPVVTFLAYWMAHPGRYEEIHAMEPAQRTAFDAAARAALDRTARDGYVVWQPVVLRVTAQA